MAGSTIITQTLVASAALAAFAVYKINNASFDAEEPSFWWRHQANRLKCYFSGEVALTMEEERYGRNVMAEFEDHDNAAIAPSDEEMLQDMGEVKGEKRTRPHRHMRAPYAYRLVRHVRGQIGQREYTPASVLVVERHARAEALDHGVRPSDYACIQPLVVALYFHSRDSAQLSAVKVSQSTATVKSVCDTTRRYRGTYGPANLRVVG
ncbi:hypothetical protein [Erysiphe necator associated tombus-like virus 8]|nr:hypothetical protein [Erysiphe necator associated tombus-like virus 8]